MRDDRKTITFDFEFAYSYQGNIVKGNCITVKEPGFQDRAVYRTMKGFIAEASAGFTRNRSESEIRDMAVEPTPVADDAAPAAAPAEADIPAYLIMSMGLRPERFVDLCNYVEKALTSNKRLAFAGDDEKFGPPITEIIWSEIAKQAGMDEVERVCSEFASFFLGRKSLPRTAPTTGTSSPATVQPDPLAP